LIPIWCICKCTVWWPRNISRHLTWSNTFRRFLNFPFIAGFAIATEDSMHDAHLLQQATQSLMFTMRSSSRNNLLKSTIHRRMMPTSWTHSGDLNGLCNDVQNCNDDSRATVNFAMWLELILRITALTLKVRKTTRIESSSILAFEAGCASHQIFERALNFCEPIQCVSQSAWNWSPSAVQSFVRIELSKPSVLSNIQPLLSHARHPSLARVFAQ
jgi:hypothetical protein